MENIGRKIFFWFLVAVFLLITPTIIFYSLGYRFSSDRGIFIYSGSATISSNPRQVDIAIDGKSISGKLLNRLNNSYHIGGISPGEHMLEVGSPEFNTWSKKLNINSGVSAEFWNVLLTRKNYEKKSIPISSITRIFLIPSKDLGAYVQEENGKFSVGVFDLQTLETDTIFSSTEFRFTDDEKENMEWSPQAHKIIIPALSIKNESKYYFIVNIQNKETTDLKSIVGSGSFRGVRWDPNHKDVIFYIADNNLLLLNLNQPDTKKLIAENVSSYDLTQGKIFYFQMPGGMIYYSDLAGTTEPVQITTSFPEQIFSDQSYKLVAYDEKRIAIIRDNKNLYIYNQGDKDTYFYKLGENIKGVQFSDDGKKLLHWSRREMYIYFTRVWEVQPFRSENETLDITRFSEEIKNVQWEKDYEHVLFSVGDKIKVAELDNRGQKNIFDVTSFDNNNPAIVENHQDNQLFFTEKDAQGKTGISVIKFPEKTGLF